MKILPVIMCGGSGTRVWPESRESLPKQFIPLVGELSTFQMAIEVLADEAFEMPVVVSNQAYRFLVGEQLLKMRRLAHIVLEPQGRDSGPAVAVAAELAARMAPDTIVAVLAADHVVRDKAGFVALCRAAAAAAREGQALEHKRSYRPWGYYQSIDDGARYQVKRIVVKPGAALSLQKHFHRAEHWVVVKGIAEVTRGNEIVLVHENESIYLPIGVIHRMANPGKIDLELIEVQTGSYLGEDDIIRIEDVYNRH